MTKRTRVIPYNPASRSAKALAEGLGGMRVKLKDSAYVPNNDDLLINWGNNSPPDTFQQPPSLDLMLNLPEVVMSVTNKRDFFTIMQGQSWLPQFWLNASDIPADAYPVVCRTVLRGHSGNGIVIANNASELVKAPLYVKYIKKNDEYRIHVGRKPTTTRDDPVFTPFSLQEKRRRLSFENPNWKIRNYDNGFIYARSEVNPPGDVIAAAVQCLAMSGLDFGAVDVIWNSHYEQAYVLEINSAPGLEGSTLEDYVNYFKGFRDGEEEQLE